MDGLARIFDDEIMLNGLSIFRKKFMLIGSQKVILLTDKQFTPVQTNK